MAPAASTPVSVKMPAMPTSVYNAGAPTSDSANISAIELPIAAMVLVRCCSRVRSAAKAVTAAEIAPAPCSARPRMVTQMPWAAAATKLPMTNTTRPKMITRFLP